MSGLFLSGSPAVHIITSSAVPATAATRNPIPRISDTPRPRRPSIKSQSTSTLPASPLNVAANGLSGFTPNFRKPAVGDTPLTHDSPYFVANPRPIVLSRNAHKKTKPSMIRATAIAVHAWSCVTFFFAFTILLCPPLANGLCVYCTLTYLKNKA